LYRKQTVAERRKFDAFRQKERAELAQLRSDLETKWRAVVDFMARVGMPKDQTT
jgi:hypothetical protein